MKAGKIHGNLPLENSKRFPGTFPQGIHKKNLKNSGRHCLWILTEISEEILKIIRKIHAEIFERILGQLSKKNLGKASEQITVRIS